ncbi:MAG: amidohydrolase family protein [Gemmatimonadota bacterium]|jgi:imidazolonepropionase-like amidohydrolase
MRDPGRRTTSTLRGACALGLAVAFSLPLAFETASAQVRMTVPPQSETIALTGATIHTVTNGVIENGTIVFDDGTITAIGADVEIPDGARVVDVDGKHIYPGLIDVYTTVGLSEIGAVDMSNDVSEVGDFNPDIRTEVAVNAESRHIGTSRSAGVLTALPTPSGGIISGMSSALALEGWTYEEMSLESAAALNVNWPNPNPGRRGFGGFGQFGQNQEDRPSYAERVQQLKDFFAEARAYKAAVDAGEDIRSDSRYDALMPVLDREIPVVVAASSAAQINDAITWAAEEDVRLVIRGGNDAIHVADRLVAEDVPVILTSTMDAPDRDYEAYDGAYRRAADLYEAGVKIAISGGSGALGTDRLPYEAGVAVAFGLPEEEAIKAVTINAAEMFGLDDRIGSLETGKQATFLITTGDPLDMMNDIEGAYIQGRELDLNDIQKFFFEKYMTKLHQRMRVIM